MVLLSSGVYAQGIKFGKHYRERVRSTRSAVVSNRPNGEETAPRQRSRGSAMLDEVSEIKGDRCFRFVYAYNKDKKRSSETIYMREKSDGNGVTNRSTMSAHTHTSMIRRTVSRQKPWSTAGAMREDSSPHTASWWNMVTE